MSEPRVIVDVRAIAAIDLTKPVAPIHPALQPVLRRAFTAAGLDFDGWERADRPHVAVLLPPAGVVVTALTVALPHHLHESLRLHNSVLPEPDHVRIRVGIHLGDDIDEAVTVLGAVEVDLEFRRSSSALGLLLSDEVFQAAVVPYPEADPAAYEYVSAPKSGLWLRTLDELTRLRTPHAEIPGLDQRYDPLASTARKFMRRASLVDGPVTIDLAVLLIPTETAEDISAAGMLLVETGIMTATGDELRFADAKTREYAAGQLAAVESPLAVAEWRSAVRRYEVTKRGAKPMARLVRDYWTTDDLLGYRPHAQAIASFLRHPDSRPPLTIGLRGPWGAGKTSMMRMVRSELDPPVDGAPRAIELTSASRRALRRGRPRRSRITNGELLRHTIEPAADAGPRVKSPADDWRATVWFNPWTYQSSEQVWAGLAHAVISQITDRLTPGDRERFWLELNLARVDRLAIRRRAYRLILERLLPAALGLVVAVVLAGIVLLAGVTADVVRWLLAGGAAASLVTGAVRYLSFRAEQATTGFPQLLSGPATGLFDAVVPDPGYAGRTGFLHLVHADMTRVLRLVATEDRPLVVFVDDLDRCTPGGVAQVIEAINLFLAGEFENCVFVLAIEPEMVAAHVAAAYTGVTTHLEADRAVGWRFLDKIIQLPLSLPPVDVGTRLPGYLAALLGTPRAEHTPRDEHALDAEAAVPKQPDETTAARLIRARNPTMASLPTIVRDVERELASGSQIPDLEARAHTLAAADAVFADLYRDTAAFEAVTTAASFLPMGNPREVKRFVNLFRFYSFITFRSRLAGAAPTDAQLAKIAALAIRWPHLLTALCRDDAALLRRLEESADDDERWAETCTPQFADLRPMLTKGPVIADAVRGLL